MPSKKPKKHAPLSPAATRIVQAALRDDVSVAELAGMAESDPAFALRVLSYVNNPVLGLGRRIDSIQQASSLLGLRGLRSLALSLVITHLAPEAEGTEMLLANCLRRAVAARHLAKRTSSVDADAAFAVGLFLDAGLLVSARDNPRTAIDIANSPACYRLIRERAAGFHGHPELAASVAKEHFLGESFATALLMHHSLTCPSDPLSKLAWAAERIAGVFEGGFYEPARTSASEALDLLKIPNNELDEILEMIPHTVVELATVFDRAVGPQLELSALKTRAEESIQTLTEQYESLVASLDATVRSRDELAESLREAETRLTELTTTDPLTGALNPQALREALDRELTIADQSPSDVSILLIDIDHFKSVNDLWGHAIGDALLTSSAEVIRQKLRSTDVFGRLGGEQFLAILPETDRTIGLAIAEEIRAALPEHALAGPKGPIAVTCSVGIASARGPGCRTAQDGLMRRATRALHEAKQQGRDRIVITE